MISKYQQSGCKLGDAAVAAHVEAMDVGILVSENRDFLSEIRGLPSLRLLLEQRIELPPDLIKGAWLVISALTGCCFGKGEKVTEV